MTTHARTIDALNEICVSLSGTGGHTFKIDALNEWCARAGKAAGHTRSINAYNAIAGGTSYWLNLEALNDISGDAGGATNATSSIAALNIVADEISGGGGGSPAQLAFADFVNGVYRVGGTTVAVASIVVKNDDWDSTFDPAMSITAEGLVGAPVIAAALTGGLMPSGLPAFTVICEILYRTSDPASVQVNVTDFPDYNFERQGNVRSVTHGALSSIQMGDESTEFPMLIGAGPHKFAMTVTVATISISVDGGNVVTVTATTPEVVATHIGLGVGSDSAAFRALTFHPPQSDAALPGLSV